MIFTITHTTLWSFVADGALIPEDTSGHEVRKRKKKKNPWRVMTTRDCEHYYASADHCNVCTFEPKQRKKK